MKGMHLERGGNAVWSMARRAHYCRAFSSAVERRVHLTWRSFSKRKEQQAKGSRDAVAICHFFCSRHAYPSEAACHL